MKKNIELFNGNFSKNYEFTKEHKRTLLIIAKNDGCAEFENREPSLLEDVDGNLISWKICDELVEMELLEEDEESFDVYFEITKDGLQIAKDIIELKDRP